ncbi:MAG: hypothetical protein AAGA02_09065 [Bacteroidota bacterium]
MAIRILLALTFFLACLDHLPAQSTSQYAGPYRVGEYIGQAEFEFSQENNDTIFNGPFLLQRANALNFVSGKDHYAFVKGYFENNVPQGVWHFEFGELAIDTARGLKVGNYQYELNAKGIFHHASGNVLEGRPNGKWTQITERIKASQVDEVLFKSVIDFDNGIPHKAFSIQNDIMTLLGRFLRDGLAHDVWELYSVETPGSREQWYFSEGELKEIRMSSGDSTITLNVNTSGIGDLKVLNLDGKYLEIVRLNFRLASGNYVEIKGEINGLLEENANHYKKIDNIFSELGEAQFMPEFKVKTGYKTLTKSELNQLNSIKTTSIKSEEITRELLGNTQINILKLSNDEALFLLSVIDELSKKHLPLLKEVTQFYDKDILPYIPRENMLTKLWSHGDLSAEIRVEYESGDSTVIKSYNGPRADEYNFLKNGIEGIHALSDYVAECVLSIQSRLNEKLTKEQRQRELAALEEKLILEITTLNHLVDSLQVEAPGETKVVLLKVKESAKKELSEYSAMQDIAKKPDQARLLTDCFRQMKQLSYRIALQPTRSNEIRAAYIDEVWNPFTATLMNEEVKKRVTGAYEEVLIPYLINELGDDLSCNNATRLTVLLDNSYKRMLELREEDTDKIERRLKRENDPLLIIRLFNIQEDKSVDQL